MKVFVLFCLLTIASSLECYDGGPRIEELIKKYCGTGNITTCFGPEFEVYKGIFCTLYSLLIQHYILYYFVSRTNLHAQVHMHASVIS